MEEHLETLRSFLNSIHPCGCCYNVLKLEEPCERDCIPFEVADEVFEAFLAVEVELLKTKTEQVECKSNCVDCNISCCAQCAHRDVCALFDAGLKRLRVCASELGQICTKYKREEKNG